MQFTPGLRKFGRAAHITSSVGWFRAVVAFLGWRGAIRLDARRGAVLSIILISIGCAAGERPLEIATTTSVVNSGLLDFIMRDLPGAQPRVHATGSGRSIAMLDQRAVDLVITHAPEAEERALAANPNWAYQKFAYNHFVILGPATDPGGVRHARNPIPVPSGQGTTILAGAVDV